MYRCLIEERTVGDRKKAMKIRFAVYDTVLEATHFVYTTLLCDDNTKCAEVTSRRDYFMGPSGILIMTSGDEPDNQGVNN